MNEEDKNQKEVQKHVNTGVVSGVVVTLIYMAYNYFYEKDSDFGLFRYIITFLLSSTLITFALVQFSPLKNEDH